MKNPKKWEDILTFTAIILSLLLININAGKWIFRWDLTEEKRYTISDASIQLMENLGDVIYIEVYLEGDLNAGVKRLQKGIREILDEFKVYAGNNLQYKFIDPSEHASVQERNSFFQQLTEKGIPSTNLVDNVDGKRTEKIIFPGALISYRNRQEGVLLLKGNKSSSPQEQLNQSIEGLEYELASNIRKLASKNRKALAFIEGHEELREQDVLDLSKSLTEFYSVDRTFLQNDKLEHYDALIIAQPKQKFSELDKYSLDQYIMNGGKVMFLMDMIQMNIDSIAIKGTYAFGYDLNIEEMLFKYGVRINKELIQDRQNPGVLDVYTGQFGNQPNLQTLAWPYYMYLMNFSEHPIVRNLDNISARFVNTIDTISSAKNIRKTPLIFTSQYSRLRKMPNLISIDEIRHEMDFQYFTKQFLPVAYLLEGEFESLFALRFPPRGINESEVLKKGESKIIVVSDGDIIRNDFDRRNNNVLPIDFDRHFRMALSNKEFMLNSLAYLTDDDGLISARKKQITLRLLDKKKLQESKLLWQSINIIIPIVLVLIFGAFRYSWRKKKFEK